MIDPAVTLSDGESTVITSATVTISTGYASGEDVLNFTTQNGITGSFNSVSGALTLTGTATVANYQTALESVTYTDTNHDASTAARTISFIASDGVNSSNTATKIVSPLASVGNTLIWIGNDDASGANQDWSDANNWYNQTQGKAQNLIESTLTAANDKGDDLVFNGTDGTGTLGSSGTAAPTSLDDLTFSINSVTFSTAGYTINSSSANGNAQSFSSTDSQGAVGTGIHFTASSGTVAYAPNVTLGSAATIQSNSSSSSALTLSGGIAESAFLTTFTGTGNTAVSARSPAPAV